MDGAKSSLPDGNERNDKDRGGTRRQFVERLAKTAALPAVLPLMLSLSTAALGST